MTSFTYSKLIGVTLCILAVKEIYAVTYVNAKRRLCVKYEIQDYQSIDEPLQITNDTETRSRCMMQCVRNFDCLAFNHHLDSATCILLPAAGCMALVSQHGYLYVHLSDCNMVPVREIRRPPDGGWRWVRTDSTGSRNDLIKLPGRPTRYASRLFIDGLYVPGYYIPGKKLPFSGVSPEHKANMNCPPNPGEFLAFNDTSEYVLITSKLRARYPILPLRFRHCMMEPLSTSSESLSLGHRDMTWQETIILFLRQIILLTVVSYLPPMWRSLSLIDSSGPGLFLTT